jgi:hypothetical protein
MAIVVLHQVARRHAIPLVLAIFGVVVPSSVVRAQNLLWAKRAGAGGIFSDQGNGVAVDSAGNSYVTGFFMNSATFAPGEANETTLTAVGSEDLFVAKYSSSGSLLWVKQAGGTLVEGKGIAVDSSGNSYVTGFYFLGSATFGPGETNQTTLSHLGSQDVFIAKYDSNGMLVWAKAARGTSGEEAFGIAVDSSGNSYMTGFFLGSTTFGQGEANETTLTSTSIDIFVAKYNSNGTLVWAKSAGGTAVDQGSGIGVDSSGNSYVTGEFAGTITFGPGEANQTMLTSTGNSDVFIAKYDSNGALLWAKRGGGNFTTKGFAIAVDSSGNSYVTGYFVVATTFGHGEATPTTLTSAGSEDIFVAKYDSNGALLWAKRAGGTNADHGAGIAVDNSGNSYVTGGSRLSATFGEGEANETTLMSAGNHDIFVAKYSSSGLLIWAKRAGGTTLDEGFAIAVDSSGNSYVTGMFTGSAIFGQGEGNQTTLTIAGSLGIDIFVAKFAGPGSSGPIMVNCSVDSLQAAVNLAAPGSTILVSGACGENLLIRNEKQRITIDGAGAGVGTRATINAPGGSPGFNVRGKGILIQNFLITGGSHGVVVNRGSNAVLNNNVIENTNGNGVLIDELAFAVLTNNTIHNSPGAGVFVSEASTARIGFNSDSDMAASPNVITNNALGITIANGSSARVAGNTIENNAGDAIQVVRDSYAEISSNQIITNGGDGIEVGENSFVQLGEDSGTNIFESPNTTPSANTGFGIRCTTGGVADGRLGTLTGNSGATSFDGSCSDSLDL